MSDTESFEDARISAQAMIYDCDIPLLDRLKAAHEREIEELRKTYDLALAQARDPQRLRGTKPDTFDGAIEALREFRWQHATNDKDAIPYINAVKEMHDREIRDTAQQQYDRGFHDGQHSMDAEHRAIAMRLRHLPLDGGSHENLSQIARAVYHSDWGWTKGACAALRDELVRLMGGVSDDTCDSQCRGACADSDGGDSGKHAEVTDERLADDCGADSCGGDGGGDLHMAGLVAYDVLDNERRKAIANLREWEPYKAFANDKCEELQIRLLYQLLGLGGAMMMDGADAAKEVRDRLIHLLGGDRPSGIDVLRAMDEREAEGRITDELREFVGTFSKRLSISVAEVNAIADRIDAQFDRICEQQEAVLQETIDEMVKEYEHDRESDQLRIEKLVEQRDEARARTDELSDELLRTRRERDEARDECDRLKRDMLDEWVPRTSYEEKVEKYRRAYMESDAWRKSLQEKLNAMRDAITAALNG